MPYALEPTKLSDICKTEKFRLTLLSINVFFFIKKTNGNGNIINKRHNPTTTAKLLYKEIRILMSIFQTRRVCNF